MSKAGYTGRLTVLQASCVSRALATGLLAALW